MALRSTFTRMTRAAAAAAIAGLCLLAGNALAQADNAGTVSDTIPASLVPGLSHKVSITVKNTGTTTWTRTGGYALSATRNPDPFAASRVDLGDSETIAPGQQKAFTFTLACGVSGSYKAEWRMSRNGTQWFGDTLARQVEVTFGPDRPGAPKVSAPAPRTVLLTNRPEIHFSGDPFDAYEVHIGSRNAADHSSWREGGYPDCWDSGEVWLPATLSNAYALSGPLPTQVTLYVFVRLHNSNGWGPWSAYGNSFCAAAEMPNEPQLVTNEVGAQRDHVICFNPDRNEYLLAYYDSRKFQQRIQRLAVDEPTVSYILLDSEGTIKAGTRERTIERSLPGAAQPMVCYNSALREYLLTYVVWYAEDFSNWRDPTQHHQVMGLRIGPDGVPRGKPQLLFETGNFRSPALAYAPPASTVDGSGSYLIAWYDSGGGRNWPGDNQIHTRLLRADGTSGTRVGPERVLTAGMTGHCIDPMIVSRPRGREFYVAFNTEGDIYGRRVSAVSGEGADSFIPLVRNPVKDSDGDLVYVPELDKFLLAYTSHYKDSCIWGQFLDATGKPEGDSFSIQTEMPSGGGVVSVAWHPRLRRFVAMWMDWGSSHNYGRLLSETGEPIGERFDVTGPTTTVGIGNWEPRPVANTLSGEFLLCWYNSYTDIYTRRYRPLPLPAPDTTPPGRISTFTVTAGNQKNTVAFMAPSDFDFSGTVIRYRTDRFPTSSEDGNLLHDRGDYPWSGDSAEHTGLQNGTTYYYAAFAYDAARNYAPAATAQATPAAP